MSATSGARLPMGFDDLPDPVLLDPVDGSDLAGAAAERVKLADLGIPRGKVDRGFPPRKCGAAIRVT